MCLSYFLLNELSFHRSESLAAIISMLHHSYDYHAEESAKRCMSAFINAQVHILGNKIVWQGVPLVLKNTFAPVMKKKREIHVHVHVPYFSNNGLSPLSKLLSIINRMKKTNSFVGAQHQGVDKVTLRLI